MDKPRYEIKPVLIQQNPFKYSNIIIFRDKKCLNN